MRKYLKETVALLIQLLMFYVFPLFAGPTDAIGMVLLIILATALLSFLLGCFSKEKMRYLYPVGVSLLFIPSVFIYYNESALVHAVWYLLISAVALMLGAVLQRLTLRLNSDRKV